MEHQAGNLASSCKWTPDGFIWRPEGLASLRDKAFHTGKLLLKLRERLLHSVCIREQVAQAHYDQLKAELP